jgi:hypothetical protein
MRYPREEKLKGGGKFILVEYVGHTLSPIVLPHGVKPLPHT